jgi:hypothetical protein
LFSAGLSVIWVGGVFYLLRLQMRGSPFAALSWAWTRLGPRVGIFLCCLAAVCTLPGRPARAAAPNAGDVRFLTGRTVVWLGRSQVIPLHVPTPPDEDATYTMAVADPGTLELLTAPEFLAGETTGYVRVRGLRAGHTRLVIHGGPALEIDVWPDPAGAAFARVDAESPLPRIVSPAPGAVVWGQFAVGVDLFDSPPTPRLDDWFSSGGADAPIPAPAKKVQLRLPNGRLLDPVSRTDLKAGPLLQFQFNVSAADFPDGNLELVAVASPDDSSNFPARQEPAPRAFESDPFIVHIQTPKAGEYWSGSCANPEILGATKELIAPARPFRYVGRVPAAAPDPHASTGKMVPCMGPDPAWCLPLIVQQPGDYQLMILARGDFAAGAWPTVGLIVNDADRPAGFVRLTGAQYHRAPVGTPIHLDAGPQMLTLQFKNDFFEGKQDRNLYLDRYELMRVGDSPPPAGGGLAQGALLPRKPGLLPPAPLGEAAAAAAPTALPQLSILYPANGAEVYGADAVVARAIGGLERPDWVDVAIDGVLQRVAWHKAEIGDPLVFPLILRGLAPGSHRLTVRAGDAAGRTVDAPEQLLTVLPQAPAARGPYERALWLLDRLAFGPEPKQLAAILTKGELPWLDAQLTGGFANPAEQAALDAACLHYPRVDDPGQTASRVLAQWIDSPAPVRSRFTAWTENHFSTWMGKTKSAAKWEEHLAFCDLGVAPFADLLDASSHSPAMLIYLDQEKSYGGKLNENYAREIMELHTLGVHGGYRQSDVTALASILTGWTLVREADLPDRGPMAHLISQEADFETGLSPHFRFVPALNEGQPRRVFGFPFSAADPGGRYDRVRVALEVLAGHPSTAEHVCRKLAEHYLGAPAPDALINRMAGVFLASGGDMRVVLRVLAVQPEFWNAPQKVATPFDFGMRLARLTRAAFVQEGMDPDQAMKPEWMEDFLRRSGMGLFDRVTPDGYPENNGAYADSNALLQRWHFMENEHGALQRLVPVAWRAVSPNESADPAQRFVDLAAVRLTGRLLSDASNRAALEVLGQGSQTEMNQTMIFVSLLPETSLR